jgi:hypothetical protein
MNRLNEEIIDNAGNQKFRSAYRDSMYFVIRKKDKTGVFDNLPNLFYTSFAIGYHFNKQEEIASKAINHVNLVSLKERPIKQLMAFLVMKRHQNLTKPKEVWKEVEKYAEYGIQVLYNSWKEKDEINIKSILKK